MRANVNAILRWFNFGVAGVTFLSYLAPYVSPQQFWPLAFAGLIYPWLLLLNLLLVVFWIFRKQVIFLLSFLTILLGWNYLAGMVGFSFFRSPDDTGGRLRVMTFNIHRFQDSKSKSYLPVGKADWPGILDRYDPDILCLQEFGFPNQSRNEILGPIRDVAGLPFRAWTSSQELAIFSRYPVLHTETQLFGRVNGYQYADIQMPDRIVRVYNVHLQSNAISGIVDRVVENGDLQEKETWLEIRGAMGRYRRAARIRAAQAETLAAQIAKSPYPIILCGDFNDVPPSYTYHTIASGLQDAFLEAGAGIGITYSGPIPALRIDYILADGVFQVLSCRRGGPSFSDHRPVVSELSF